MHVVCAMWNKNIKNEIEPYPITKTLLDKDVIYLNQFYVSCFTKLFINRLVITVHKKRVFVFVVKNPIVQRKFFSLFIFLVKINLFSYAVAFMPRVVLIIV